MKFTDGYWLLREGVTAAHPVEVLDVTVTDGTLRVHAPTRPVRHRGDLLKGPVVTIDAHAPMPDVIGVTFTHFEGERPRGPRFELTTEEFTPHTSYDDEHATLTAGELSVRVSRTGPWRVDFLAHGRTLTTSGPRSMGIMREASGAHHLREQLNLGVGTSVYGLGERFGPLVKNGQTVDVWNADGGTATEQAYKNVPFYLTDAGYGVFVDHPGRVSFEVASEVVSRVQFSAETQQLTYYVIYGPTPKEILRKYTALTGRPALPPAWSFGLWLSTSFTTSYDEETVTSFIDGMRSAGCRCPSSTSTVSGCASSSGATSRGTPGSSPIRRACWRASSAGSADQRLDQPLHRPALPAVRRGQGPRPPSVPPGRRRLAVGPLAARMALVDFTSPAARAWYASKLEALLAQAWTASKPTSASGCPWTWRGPTAPTRSGCTTTTRTSTTARSSTCCASTGARVRRCSSPGPRRPAARASPSTGAATASRRTRRWPSRCAAGCRWAVGLRVLEP
ncbi:glycoside hydrolase family 31 protein [Streptomyces scabiei]